MDCSLRGGASDCLDAFYEEYDGFDVRQTTVGVDPETLAELAGRPDGPEVQVRVRVRVWATGEDGVLMLPDEDGWALPGGVVEGVPTPGAVSAILEEQTGIRCEMDGLERVSIVCLRCDATDERVWTLKGLFTANAVGGTPRGGAVYREAKPRASPGSPSL